MQDICQTLHRMPGKPFQKGHDPRRNYGAVTTTKKGKVMTLPDLKNAIIKAFNQEQGGINAVEAMIRGQIKSAMMGNTRAFEVLMQLGYRKDLEDAMNQGNELERTTTVGLFDPPKQASDYITYVEEI